ncbi:hypothetical protein L1049_016608 [Liquidambar formosana]|uniref:Oxidoreductase N-terminal domain-containing protein n=1 Tax=Liquidambar formosana TaxID=63359 RepID=A0AAP0X0Q2_LIQFO
MAGGEEVSKKQVIEEVSNKQVILKDYVSGFPKETDLELRTETIALKVPQGSNAIVVKNLYLSCDPSTRLRMHKIQEENSVFTSYTPGSALTGCGVAKVLDSGHPDFKKGDLIFGITGWEEYSIITTPETFIKIQHSDISLSYYVGILGKFFSSVNGF